MGILLLIISLIFSGIFFMFFQSGESSFLGFPLIEAFLFLFLGLFLFFIFSGFGYKKEEKISSFNTKNFLLLIRKFYKQYLYYIGFILFYFSIFLILRGFGADKIAFFIFVVNLIIGSLFFLSDKFFIFKDFIKTNTILFSILYIFWFILIQTTGNDFFTILDYLNTCIIALFFILTLRLERVLLKRDFFDTTFLSYFSIYILLTSIFYSSYFIDSLFLNISIIGTFISITFFISSENIETLRKSKKNLKIISLIFLYIASLSGVYYLFFIGFSFLVFLSLFVSGIFNYLVHRHYQNYISFCISFGVLFFLFCYTFFQVFYTGDYKNFLLVSNFFLVSFSMVFYSYFFRLKYFHDNFFVHSFAYIVNLFGVFCFLYFVGFDILYLGIILLLDSIFVFLSYYKLNSLQKNIS